MGNKKMKYTFMGDCYMCGKRNFIVRVDSWSGQKSGGVWISGSWRNFCNDCCDEWGCEPNRKKPICIMCQKAFLGNKWRNVCLSCCESTLVQRGIRTR